MQKVKIISTTHPRLNAGFVYIREEVAGVGTRFTSLGGKHSVFINLGHASSTVWEPVVGSAMTEAGRTFHTEPHVRIGERIAADLWKDEYLEQGEAKADWAAEAFLKRWQEGFFRGEAKA